MHHVMCVSYRHVMCTVYAMCVMYVMCMSCVMSSSSCVCHAFGDHSDDDATAGRCDSGSECPAGIIIRVAEHSRRKNCAKH